MREPFFIPWQGQNYAKHRTVIMSESTYDWQLNGEWRTPTPEHPITCVEQAIEEEDHARFFVQLTRALCRSGHPTQEERKANWNDFGYTVYVQGSIGKGPARRPSAAQWRRATELFPRQLERFEPKPQKLIVTGISAWNSMPFTQVQLTSDLQAFEYNGALLWCLALPHTANRQKGRGFNWLQTGNAIRAFLSTSFPGALS